MNLRPAFEPRTMGVIGVSTTNLKHPANEIFHKNFFRYPVRVFAVNPKGGTLDGEPVYSKISEVPEPLDLAVIAARADLVPEILHDCISSGVGAAAIISGGFKEVGRDDLQEKITALAKEADFPFIGPNCLGIYVPSVVDTFFLPVERMVKPEPGNVSFVSQSGGILVDMMIKFASERVGLAKAVSIGNKAVIRELDLLKYFCEDPSTGVIAFYIEGFEQGEGRDFVQFAQGCSKPVIALKAGKTLEGSKAVSSHTASMAGDYLSFSSALSQHGILEAKSEQEFVSFCESLSAYRKPIDGRVGIVTGSGGHGAVAVDVCSAHGLEAPSLTDASQEELRTRVSDRVASILSAVNPIDLTGSAVDDDFIAAAEVLSSLDEIDCILVLLLPYLPGITSDLGSKLSSLSRRFKKPMIAYVPHVDKYDMLIEGFELNGVPVSPSIEGAVLMVKAIRRM
ncbi:MAG: CoA-binding protein [Desulfomonilia bacterium]|nr:CoA-binding protein [Desulfomonilia bacterium]